MVAEERTSAVVSKAAVNQVTLVGTKAATSSSSTSSSSSSAAGTGPTSGSASGESCGASYYDEPQMTANGEVFNPYAYTAAHKTLPFNSMVKVTNPTTGKSVVVRINDRGPYISGRCLDLSVVAFQAIAPLSAGHVTVTWQIVG